MHRHADLGRRDLAVRRATSWSIAGRDGRRVWRLRPQGDWLIEGHGVDPDIVVDNLPHATFNGSDRQLAAAVKLLKQKLKEEPVTLPPVPAFPKK